MNCEEEYDDVGEEDGEKIKVKARQVDETEYPGGGPCDRCGYGANTEERAV